MFRKEEYALVVDFLPHGKAGEGKQEPIAQVLGESYFTLLEVVLKPNLVVAPFERVYIGKAVRDKVERIKARLTYKDLTNVGQQEIEKIIRKILESHEAEYVQFLNRAGSINIRIHSLELLPGVGKKNLEAFIAEREKEPFKTFEDINSRMPHLQKVEEIILHRIMQELKGEDKYYLFVKIPPREEGEEGDRDHNRGERRYGDRNYGDRSHSGYGDRPYHSSYGERRSY
jgi:putative nucleotide binding protein